MGHIKFAAILLACFAGSFCGSSVFSAKPLEVATEERRMKALQFYNDNGQRTGFFGTDDRSGVGVGFLFNQDGRLRLQMGTYPSGAEKDQSLFGLHDRRDALRLLFRLHDENDTPTIIMKDKYGVDKMIIGLRGDNEMPYLEYMDASGRRRDLFAQ